MWYNTKRCVVTTKMTTSRGAEINQESKDHKPLPLEKKKEPTFTELCTDVSHEQIKLKMIKTSVDTCILKYNYIFCCFLVWNCVEFNGKWYVRDALTVGSLNGICCQSVDPANRFVCVLIVSLLFISSNCPVEKEHVGHV